MGRADLYTQRKESILAVIRGFDAPCQATPRAISRRTGYSESAIYSYLHRMRDEGLVVFQDRRHHTLQLVETFDRAADEQESAVA